MRRLFSKFHLWLSVPFGIVITITCFTGALLVFEEEITTLCNGVADIKSLANPLPLDVIADKVDDSLSNGVEITGILVSKASDKPYKVNLSEPKRTAIYVDQYTGEILGNDERLPFFQTVFRLHRWLMDENPGSGVIFWGKVIVGASTLAFVVILMTGLVIWWPRNRKMLRNRLRIAVTKGANRFCYDLHVVGGFYLFLLLLAMALTGLNWSFDWYRDGVYSLFGVCESKEVAANKSVELNKKVGADTKVCSGSCRTCTLPVCVNSTESNSEAGDNAVQDNVVSWNVDAVTAATSIAETKYIDAEDVAPISEVDGVTAATAVDAHSGATMLAATSQTTKFRSWQLAFENVAARVPNYKSITVSAGTISVKSSYFGNVWATDKYIFNENSGEIESFESYGEADYESKVDGWFYSVHTGVWGGLFTRLLSFIAALLGAALPLTGYYFWIKRLYGRRKSRK